MAVKSLKKKVLLGLMTQGAIAVLAASCQVDTAQPESEEVDEAQQAASTECTCQCKSAAFHLCAVSYDKTCPDFDYVRKGLTAQQCKDENGGACSGYSVVVKLDGKLTDCTIAATK